MLLSEPEARRALSVPLTPLIDIVFILLLFFMLSSSFSQVRMIDFQPKVRNASSVPEPTVQNTVWLKLRSDSTVTIREQRVSITHPDFMRYLDAMVEENTKVTVSAQADVSIQNLVVLLDQIHAAGISDLSLAETWH